jgi:hypothetical protein
MPTCFILASLPYHVLSDAEEVSNHATKELIRVAKWMEKKEFHPTGGPEQERMDKEDNEQQG